MGKGEEWGGGREKRGGGGGEVGKGGGVEIDMYPTNLFEHHIYWAASIDVNKVHLHLTVEQLGTTGHAVCKGAAYLHPKQVLTLVSLHQSPLTLLALGCQIEAVE